MTNPETRFRTVSLGDWLALAEQTGTPHVPATEIAEVRIDDLLSYDSPGPVKSRLTAVWKQMAAARRPRTMFRWDCCASEHLKHLMANARQPRNEVQDLQSLVIDSRVYELASEYPDDTLRIWRRPWIRDEMLMFEGYPVEYRAFIRRARVTGISSYYPQRPLRECRAEIDAVRQWAAGLAAALSGPLVWPMPIPGNAETPDADESLTGENGVHATIDFVVCTDGRILLLEGGPPHFAGGHPCCFEGRDTIEGVALQAAEAH